MGGGRALRAQRAGAGALLVLVLALAGCGGPSTDEAVVRAWSDAVREGQYQRAADLFALPSTIENGVTVRATRRSDVDVFNRSLSCGAVLQKTVPVDGDRVLATFRLVDGPGSSPCAGEAQVRFRIQEGRITEWVRQDTGPPPDAQES